MPKAKDDLAQRRALRDDLRALKAQYPELTSPESQARLTAYMRTQTDDVDIPTERKERPMPAKGDRTLGEDLANLTFKVPASALPAIEAHLRAMQRTSRWQRIGRSDALRDIFLRGIDSIENPTQQFPVVLDAPQLPLPSPRLVEPAATSAGGAIPTAPAYEARALTPDLTDDDDLEDMPLEPEQPLTMEPPEVTQESVVPEAPAATVRPARARRTARPKANPPMPIKPKRASRAQRGD